MAQPPTVDYRDLLSRYMEHVRECEGIDFTDRLNSTMDSNVPFLPDEVALLEKIAEEIDAKWTRDSAGGRIS